MRFFSLDSAPNPLQGTKEELLVRDSELTRLIAKYGGGASYHPHLFSTASVIHFHFLLSQLCYSLRHSFYYVTSSVVPFHFLILSTRIISRSFHLIYLSAFVLFVPENKTEGKNKESAGPFIFFLPRNIEFDRLNIREFGQ